MRIKGRTQITQGRTYKEYLEVFTPRLSLTKDDRGDIVD